MIFEASLKLPMCHKVSVLLFGNERTSSVLLKLYFMSVAYCAFELGPTWDGIVVSDN